MGYSSIKIIEQMYKKKEHPLLIKSCKKFLPLTDILLTFVREYDGAYTRVFSYSPSGDPIFKLVLGGQMIFKIIDAPKIFKTSSDARKYYNDMHKSFVGLYMHEMGHLIYTDMVSRDIVDYKDKQYVNFIHQLNNILEDVHIEKYRLARDYPWSRKYFTYLTQRVFEPQCSSYCDDGSSAAFMNYLLLKLRCVKKMTAHNAVFDSVASDILPMISGFLNDNDGSSRIKKAIALAEWLIANTKLDFTSVSKPSAEETSGGMGSVPVSSTGVGSGKPSASSGSSSGSSSDSSRSADTAEEITPKSFKSVKELEESEENLNEIESSYDPSNDILIDNFNEVSDSFNSVLTRTSALNHEFMIAKDYFKYNQPIMDIIDKRLKAINPMALKAIRAIKLFKARVKPRLTSGFNNGRLDMKSAIKSVSSGIPTPKLFSQKIASGQAADLAVSILCDNSGSMYGNKSYVCTNAMLALAEACDRAGIPVEVNCFTKAYGINYTIRMKQFNEKFEKAKYYFGITACDIFDCYISDDETKDILFSGNEDEVNLYWIWKDLQRNCKHTDKLIIVISDGETCGSSDDLRNVISEIKKDGIKVIGLGIQSSAVRTLYPEYKLFDTDESLNGLPDYLMDTLNKLIRK